MSQAAARAGPGVQGLPMQQSSVNMGQMEEALARQLAQQKITDDRRRREIEKLCGESDELRELQAKIKAAYLNKERSQQMTEKQYRMQNEIVSYFSSTNNFLIRWIGTRCSDRHHHVEEQGDR